MISEFRSVGEQLVGGIFTVTAISVVLICQHCDVIRRSRRGSSSPINIMIIFFWILYFFCCAYSLQSVTREFLNNRSSAHPQPIFGVIFVATEAAFSLGCMVVHFVRGKKSGRASPSDGDLRVPLLDPAADDLVENDMDEEEDESFKTFPESPEVTAPTCDAVCFVRDCHEYMTLECTSVLCAEPIN